MSLVHHEGIFVVRNQQKTTDFGWPCGIRRSSSRATCRPESGMSATTIAAWLGLTPRQMTTGGKPRLLGISKRGNCYLRKNLIHGARAVLPYLVERETPLGRWARALLARAHKNVVVLALANKLARIAWAVLAHGCGYDAKCEAASAGAGRRDSACPTGNVVRIRVVLPRHYRHRRARR
jgi:hypothetical protein